MMTITLGIPEHIHQRLVTTAQATQQSINDVILRVLQVGSPPTWDDVPQEFQADLAALDRLDNGTLWQIARSQNEADLNRYDELLHQNQNGSLTAFKSTELADLRKASEKFMLRKAQAAALLKWRGHSSIK